MKNTLLFLALCLCIQGMSQNASTDGVSSMMQLYDNNGNPLLGVKRNRFINSPYLNDNWGRGEVVFGSGKKLKNAVLRFNLNDQKLHYQIGDIEFMFLDPVAEFSYTYTEEDKPYSIRFRNGYPGVKPEEQYRYYEILAENTRYELLKFIAKKVEDYYEYNGPSSRIYKLFTSLYLFDKQEKILVPARGKKLVEERMPALIENLKLLSASGKNIPEKDWINWFSTLQN